MVPLIYDHVLQYAAPEFVVVSKMRGSSMLQATVVERAWVDP